MQKKWSYIYIGIIMLILWIPLIGMMVRPTTETTENRDMAEFPQLLLKGEINHQFLAQMGMYFEDHFAFRPEMVAVNAVVRSRIFSTSATDQIIDGDDDWLYFSGTLDDYQGERLLSERSLYMIAHNLSLLQEAVESAGAAFFYTVSPNKNTLYGENMPYYCKAGTESNLERLVPYLEAEDVHYIDLVNVFKEQKEILYLKRDSHWNNKGAVLAYNALLDAMGKEHENYQNIPYEIRQDYIGDLNSMLYSVNAEPEDNYYYQFVQKYQCAEEADDVEDDWTIASNIEGSGSLLMFRDSFGNTLFPLMANEFAETYYTKLEPYSLNNVYRYYTDYVLVERVERRIASVIEKPPIMQGPVSVAPKSLEIETDSTVQLKKSGSYYVVSGEIDKEYLEDNTRIYVSIFPSGMDSGIVFEASGMLIEKKTGELCDNGYQLYLYEQTLPEDEEYVVQLIAVDDNGSHMVANKKVKVKNGGK